MERLECRGRIGEGGAGLARGVSATHVWLRRVPSLRDTFLSVSRRHIQRGSLARRIAANIAKLPELLRQPKGDR